MSKTKYYAVRTGRVPGIYESWEACRAQVHGFKEAEYKSFATRGEAEAFLKGNEENTSISADSTLMEAYVDGSFSEEKQSYSYGMVVLYEGEEYHQNGSRQDPDTLSMRNVAGEIWGASMAMKLAMQQGVQDLVIYHDYEGIAKWCTGQWKANLPMTQAYRAYYNGLPDGLKVRFVKVKGHSGNHYNELADQLAKEALGIGKPKYVWVGVNLQDQLPELEAKVKEVENACGLKPPLELPRHVSLKISFQVPPEMVCPVTETILAYLRRQKPFEIRPEKTELLRGIVWLRMHPDEELNRIHAELDALLKERFGIPITELDSQFIFHSTLFIAPEPTDQMEEEQAAFWQGKLGEAYEKMKNLALPASVRASRFLLGMSDSGLPDSYTVYRRVEIGEICMQ